MSGLVTDRAEIKRPGAEVEPIDLVPELARHVLFRNGARRAETYAEPIRSVVMLADLTGFSLLGARLVARSERGSEELRSLINAVFECVVGVISAHGGSVLHYAGDAVTAAWPYAEGELGSAATRAIGCGLDVQTACEHLSGELGGQSLAMRIALSEGDVSVVHVPETAIGPQVVFCGEVLAASASNARRGTRNGIALSPDLLAQAAPALVGRGVVLERDAAGARVVALKHPLPAQARRGEGPRDGLDAYVQASVRGLLGHSTAQWLAGGDSVPLSKLYIGMALISTLLPWALDGDELQRQSLAVADRLGDPATSSFVYMVSGVYETGKGGWATGDEHLQRAREIGERCGERKNWETAMSCLGNLKRLEGRFEEAKSWSDMTLVATRDRGITHGIIWSHNGRARDLLCLSRLDEAREEVAALEKLLNDPAKKQDSNDNNSLVYHYARIFCALDERDDRTALKVLDDLMAILGRIKRPQVYMVQNVDYYSDIIWSLWKRGHRGALLAHQALVAKSGRQVAKQYRTGRPMAQLAAGDGAWYRGRKAQAAKHWLASAGEARLRGMRYNQAHALLRLDETGLLPSGSSGAAWQPLVKELGIRRPAIWSLPA